MRGILCGNDNGDFVWRRPSNGKRASDLQSAGTLVSPIFRGLLMHRRAVYNTAIPLRAGLSECEIFFNFC